MGVIRNIGEKVLKAGAVGGVSFLAHGQPVGAAMAGMAALAYQLTDPPPVPRALRYGQGRLPVFARFPKRKLYGMEDTDFWPGFGGVREYSGGEGDQIEAYSGLDRSRPAAVMDVGAWISMGTLNAFDGLKIDGRFVKMERLTQTGLPYGVKNRQDQYFGKIFVYQYFGSSFYPEVLARNYPNDIDRSYVDANQSWIHIVLVDNDDVTFDRLPVIRPVCGGVSVIDPSNISGPKIFTNNCAAVEGDIYSTMVEGIDGDNIDWLSIQKAYNRCLVQSPNDMSLVDSLTHIKLSEGLNSSTYRQFPATSKRASFSGVVEQNGAELSEILDFCDWKRQGTHFWNNGKLSITVGDNVPIDRPNEPLLHLTDDDVALDESGRPQLVPRALLSRRFNAVRGTVRSGAHNFEEIEFILRDDDVIEKEGEERVHDLGTVRYCTDLMEVVRTGNIMLMRQRASLFIPEHFVKATRETLELLPADPLLLSSSYHKLDHAPCRVMLPSKLDDGRVRLTLLHEPRNTFEDSYNPPDAKRVQLSLPQPAYPEEIVIDTVRNLVTGVNTTVLTYKNRIFYPKTFLRWRLATDTEWAGTREWINERTASREYRQTFAGLFEDETDYIVQLANANRNGRLSDWSDDIDYNPAKDRVAPPVPVGVEAEGIVQGVHISKTEIDPATVPDYDHTEAVITYTPTGGSEKSVTLEFTGTDGEKRFSDIAKNEKISLSIVVKDVDRSGNKSDGVTVTATTESADDLVNLFQNFPIGGRFVYNDYQQRTPPESPADTWNAGSWYYHNNPPPSPGGVGPPITRALFESFGVAGQGADAIVLNPVESGSLSLIDFADANSERLARRAGREQFPKFASTLVKIGVQGLDNYWGIARIRTLRYTLDDGEVDTIWFAANWVHTNFEAPYPTFGSTSRRPILIFDFQLARGAKGERGDDGEGVEYIWLATDSEDRPTDVPSNDWGYDNPQGDFTDGAELSADKPNGHRYSRGVAGTPTFNESPYVDPDATPKVFKDGWTAWKWDKIQARWGQDGQGREDVWLATDSEDRPDDNPSNDWGYDAPQGDFTDGPKLSADKRIGHLYRRGVAGTPEDGESPYVDPDASVKVFKDGWTAFKYIGIGARWGRDGVTGKTNEKLYRLRRDGQPKAAKPAESRKYRETPFPDDGWRSVRPSITPGKPILDGVDRDVPASAAVGDTPNADYEKWSEVYTIEEFGKDSETVEWAFAGSRSRVAPIATNPSDRRIDGVIPAGFSKQPLQISYDPANEIFYVYYYIRRKTGGTEFDRTWEDWSIGVLLREAEIPDQEFFAITPRGYNIVEWMIWDSYSRRDGIESTIPRNLSNTWIRSKFPPVPGKQYGEIAIHTRDGEIEEKVPTRVIPGGVRKETPDGTIEQSSQLFRLRVRFKQNSTDEWNTETGTGVESRWFYGSPTHEQISLANFFPHYEVDCVVRKWVPERGDYADFGNPQPCGIVDAGADLPVGGLPGQFVKLGTEKAFWQFIEVSDVGGLQDRLRDLELANNANAYWLGFSEVEQTSMRVTVHGGGATGLYGLRYQRTDTLLRTTWTTEPLQQSHIFDLSPLDAGTTYNIQVTKTSPDADRIWSRTFTHTTEHTIPIPAPVLTGGLTFTLTDETGFKVTWTEATGVFQGYRIFLDDVPVGFVTAEEYSFLGTLEANTQYRVSVQAENEGVPSNRLSDTHRTSVAPGTAPAWGSGQRLTLTTERGVYIRASWPVPETAGENALFSYRYRERSIGTTEWGAYQPVQSVGEDRAVLILGDSGSEYEVGIQASNAHGESGWLENTRTITESLGTEPTWPAGAGLTVLFRGANRIRIEWPEAVQHDSPGGHGALQYYFSKSSDGVFDTEPETLYNKDNFPGLDDRQIDFTGLTAGSTIYLRIRAKDNNGYSTPLTVRLQTQGGQTVAPQWETGAELTLWGEAVDGFTASWDGASHATGYHYQVATDEDFHIIVRDEIIVEQQIPITKLASNTAYWVRVQADNAGRTNGFLPAKTTTTLRQTLKPTWPSDAEIRPYNVEPDSFSIAWPEALGQGTMRYQVEIRKNGRWVTSPLQEERTFDFDNLTEQTAYPVRVRANNGRNSDYRQVTVTTRKVSKTAPRWPNLPHPGARLGFEDISSTGFTITWPGAESTTAITYYVTVSTNADFSGASPNRHSVGSATSYAFTGNPGTTYYCRVVAENADGPSPALERSQGTYVATVARPVWNAGAEARIDTISATGLTAHWDDATGETGWRYELSRSSTPGQNLVPGAFGTINDDDTSRSKRFDGLLASTDYWFRVWPVNGGGATRATDDPNGTGYREAMATTLAAGSGGPPPPPGGQRESAPSWGTGAVLTAPDARRTPSSVTLSFPAAVVQRGTSTVNYTAVQSDTPFSGYLQPHTFFNQGVRRVQNWQGNEYRDVIPYAGAFEVLIGATLNQAAVFTFENLRSKTPVEVGTNTGWNDPAYYIEAPGQQLRIAWTTDGKIACNNRLATVRIRSVAIAESDQTFDRTKSGIVLSTGATTGTAVFDQLTAGEEYYFGVAASNDEGTTSDPKWLVVKTTAGSLAGGAPRWNRGTTLDLTVNSATSLTATWVTPQQGVVTEYRYQYTDQEGEFSWSDIPEHSAGTNLSVRLDRLNAGRHYRFIVRAYNGSVQGGFLWGSKILRLENVPKPTFPAGAKAFLDTPGITTMRAVWTPGDANTSGYRYELATGGAFANIVLRGTIQNRLHEQEEIDGIDYNTVPFTGLDDDQEYFFRVWAVGGGGESDDPLTSGGVSTLEESGIPSWPFGAELSLDDDVDPNPSTDGFTVEWPAAVSSAVGGIDYYVEVANNASFNNRTVSPAQRGRTYAFGDTETVTSGTDYWVRVYARNARGTTDNPKYLTKKFRTADPPAGVPFWPQVNGQDRTVTFPLKTSTSFRAEWVEPSNGPITEYRYKISTTEGDFSGTNNRSTGTRRSITYNVPEADRDKTHYIRVVAQNAQGWSTAPIFGSVDLSPDTTVTAPTWGDATLSLAQGRGQLTATWDKAVGGATSYYWEIFSQSDYATRSRVLHGILHNVSASQETFTQVITPLANNTTYWLRVSAHNVGGTTANPQYLFANQTTLDPEPDLPAPELGGDLSLTVLTNYGTGTKVGIRAEWPQAEGEVSKYVLQWATAPLSHATSPSDIELEPDQLIHSVGNLLRGTTYYFGVYATNDSDQESSTLYAHIDTPHVPPRWLEVKRLTIEDVSHNSFKASWLPASTNTEYYSVHVYKYVYVTHRTPGGRGVRFRTIRFVKRYGPTVTEQVVDGLSASTDYKVVVRPHNDGGFGGALEQDVTTVGTPPVAPTLSGTLTFPSNVHNNFQVQWTPATGNVSNYTVEYSERISWVGSETETASATVGDDGKVTYTLTGDLTAGTPYHFRVKANGPGGESDWIPSDLGVSVTATAPPAPTIGQGVTVEQGQTPGDVTFHWAVGNAVVDGYAIDITEEQGFGAYQTRYVSGRDRVSYSWSGTPGGTYWVRIRSYAGDVSNRVFSGYEPNRAGLRFDIDSE